ncbi:MAG: PEP-CTERM sorting domain-containing protein [Syntrophobacteraceae bacterium]
MKKQSLYTIFTLGLALAALIIYSAPANATATLELISGSSTVTVADGSGSGVVGYSGTVGGWDLNVSTGVTYPFSGTASLPNLDLNSVNYSTSGSAPLEILFSDTGFVPPPAATLNVGGTISGLTSVQASAYYDTSDTILATTVQIYPTYTILATTYQIGSTLSFTSAAFSGTTGGNINANGPISITELVVLDPDGGSGSIDASVTTPEPGTLFLLGTGLLGLGALRKRFKKA